MTVVKGRRAATYEEFWADPPGVWWKWDRVRDGDDVGPRWLVRPPCGHHFMLAHGTPRHEVDEHADGTISVERKPGNSNSILCVECGWHGWIRRGEWYQ